MSVCVLLVICQIIHHTPFNSYYRFPFLLFQSFMLFSPSVLYPLPPSLSLPPPPSSPPSSSLLPSLSLPPPLSPSILSPLPPSPPSLQADEEVTDILGRFTSAKQKKRASSRKEREAAWKALERRDSLYQKLEQL